MKRPRIEEFTFIGSDRLGGGENISIHYKEFTKEATKYIDYLEAKFNNVGLANVRLSFDKDDLTNAFVAGAFIASRMNIGKNVTNHQNEYIEHEAKGYVKRMLNEA